MTLAGFVPSLAASQLVEMRLVVDKPSDDAELMTLDKEALLVQKTVLLNEADLKTVAVSTDTPISHPQPGLVFQFTKDGWKHFSKVAREHNGQRLAMVVDGQIYAAPVIRPQHFFAFHGQLLEFHGPFTEQKAIYLAAKIDRVLPN